MKIVVTDKRIQAQIKKKLCIPYVIPFSNLTLNHFSLLYRVNENVKY